MNGIGITAVVLAGGASRRMGAVNKLLSPVGGQPMLRHVLAAVSASRVDDVVVVTGFDAEGVRTCLDGFDVRFAHNPRFADGLSTSLRAGVLAVPDTAAGVVIVLGDMPHLKSATIDALVRRFLDSDGAAVCVPVHRGRRGNPVLWPRACFADILSLSGDTGARRLIDTYRERVSEVAVDDDGVHVDIDTPADLNGESASPAVH